jgi:hypothetical protein
MCKDEFAEGGGWQAKLLGQSAATAAAQAIDDQVAVQQAHRRNR